MRVVIDIEANGLENPTKIWLIICKDIDTGEFHIFRNLVDDDTERKRFDEFSLLVDCWIGHNILGYDIPVLLGKGFLAHVHGQTYPTFIDTLIISKLANYPREKHSIEDYGKEFGYLKGVFSDFSKYSLEMEEYCVRDVEICHRVYSSHLKYISNPAHCDAIRLEHQFQLIVNKLHDNGFAFDSDGATRLLWKVERQLEKLDEAIAKEFPPRQVLVREFTPRLTKHGTISRTSVPRHLHDNISNYVAGQSYPVYRTDVFNPASHKQIIDVLHEAGWQPVNKTKTHIEADRTIKRSKWSREQIDVSETEDKLIDLAKYGWKIDEANLATLPDTAPQPARSLAKRIMLESRRRTLTEWLGLVGADGRIHGKFYGIGAWTHRMAHQNPNTANIPTDAKLYGKEMRSLWIAPKGRLLIGVDAEGIQLRIFAHYINDPEFIDALVRGRKDDKTDPHSLNQRILGSICKSRAIAKRFIFAFLLGAGTGKLGEILSSSETEGRKALDRLYQRYTGLQILKETIIPQDAKRGYFTGIDGRSVPIPAETDSRRRHLCMSGYLQNGETVVMRDATVRFDPLLEQYDTFLTDLVHDEWQGETPNDVKIALQVCEIMADSLRKTGIKYKLNCPLEGSYWSDEHKDYTIGVNWWQTH